jgi:UDP-N-acetylmuramate--alanine ligase
MFAKIQRIHFVGIGGIGMSGIAEVLLNLGYGVSGSDVRLSPVTERLQSLGAKVYEGHKPEHIAGSHVVVISSAVRPDNPEVIAAREQHVPVIPRAEMLAELMRLKYGIAVGGMHGKTTTTSMIAAVLAAGGLDPTVVVGGRVDAMGSNARVGKSEYLVAEADESDRSFLKLSPIVEVVTNIDREHMDCYRDLHDVEQTFLEFMDRVPFYGIVVACNDDEMLRGLLPSVRRRVITYGTREDSYFRIVDLRCAAGSDGSLARSTFRIQYRGKDLGEFRLRIPGEHNVRNATAAIAVGTGLDVPVASIREALESFRGVDRRFQIKGRANGITVIDDYGHHPTEIRATLAAARQCGFRRVHVIFQPHRYSRTQLLMADFATAFGDADSLLLLDIYPASEAPISGITSQRLAQRISAADGRKIRCEASFADAAQRVAEIAEPGDMVLTLGAGSVAQLGPLVLEAVERRGVVDVTGAGTG